MNGLAHITGGGLTNIPRMSDSVDYIVDHFPNLEEVAPIFQVLADRSQLPAAELFRTFNMGVGMVLATANPDRAHQILSKSNLKSWTIGEITDGQGNSSFHGTINRFSSAHKDQLNLKYCPICTFIF